MTRATGLRPLHMVRAYSREQFENGTAEDLLKSRVTGPWTRGEAMSAALRVVAYWLFWLVSELLYQDTCEPT